MPWTEATTMDARAAFIVDWESQKHQMTALCARPAVSRKAAYGWVQRYQETADGLWERRHALNRWPHTTSDEVEQAFVQQSRDAPGSASTVANKRDDGPRVHFVGPFMA